MIYNFDMKKRNWNAEATKIIQLEKVLGEHKWKDVAKLLKQKTGEVIDPNTLANKINNGSFSFSFAIQILTALEVDVIDISSLRK